MSFTLTRTPSPYEMVSNRADHQHPIDTKGRDLIEENKGVFDQKKKPILERINQQVRFIK